jgi:hypothetical protein
MFNQKRFRCGDEIRKAPEVLGGADQQKPVPGASHADGQTFASLRDRVI